MRRSILALLMLVGTAAAAEPMPQLEGNIYIHDPSIIATATGWASFATGVEGAADAGMPRTKSSPDGITWTETGAIPGGLPAWIKEELRYTPKNLWAPTVSVRDGITYLYYSASRFGRNNSAIGVMTNPAFDATKPADGWVDQGLVFRSKPGDWLNAIDPFRIDVGDRAWLAFGSYWDGIRMIEVDPVTGLRNGTEEPLRIASRNGEAIEAAAILEHGGHFFLFVSFDACCRGIASTYRILVGRADAVTGPYLDRDGKPMLDGGGTELLRGTGRFIGPGGQEVFTVAGAPWLAFHYYDREDEGAPKLQLAPLGFDAAGWPEIGPLPE
jgi:arabinan endo-1,5-alpha-L-arabinosidase